MRGAVLWGLAALLWLHWAGIALAQGAALAGPPAPGLARQAVGLFYTLAHSPATSAGFWVVASAAMRFLSWGLGLCGKGLCGASWAWLGWVGEGLHALAWSVGKLGLGNTPKTVWAGSRLKVAKP